MKTWLFNVILGFSAFLFTFFFSIINNTLETSLLRAAMGFILFFVLAYALRYVLAQKNMGITTKSSKMVETFSESEKKNDENELEHSGLVIYGSSNHLPLWQVIIRLRGFKDLLRREGIGKSFNVNSYTCSHLGSSPGP